MFWPYFLSYRRQFHTFLGVPESCLNILFQEQPTRSGPSAGSRRASAKNAVILFFTETVI